MYIKEFHVYSQKNANIDVDTLANLLLTCKKLRFNPTEAGYNTNSGNTWVNSEDTMTSIFRSDFRSEDQINFNIDDVEIIIAADGVSNITETEKFLHGLRPDQISELADEEWTCVGAIVRHLRIEE